MQMCKTEQSITDVQWTTLYTVHASPRLSRQSNDAHRHTAELPSHRRCQLHIDTLRHCTYLRHITELFGYLVEVCEYFLHQVQSLTQSPAILWHYLQLTTVFCITLPSWADCLLTIVVPSPTQRSISSGSVSKDQLQLPKQQWAKVILQMLHRICGENEKLLGSLGRQKSPLKQDLDPFSKEHLKLPDRQTGALTAIVCNSCIRRSLKQTYAWFIPFVDKHVSGRQNCKAGVWPHHSVAG